ncbi:histidine phosphatase family protein [Pedobacter sp. SD-b]|uniref:Histidine phosphatase family protein n=1 Tax=Pedobacter segetis TaxID=2793069 RepID=A0ABS1BLS2_9SPHI|nr:histidine phosphatase family protein [Pedobacter segetis]MBK0383691.1 histidine phosphatase family protein [Pedobacter segetis]
MNIYLIRHTSVYNPNKLCYGQSEMPLEENFTVDFDWIKDHLNFTTGKYYSSPLRRCTKLAAYLSDDAFDTDERLSELNFGDWEMKPWLNINQKDIKAWEDDFINYRVKKGERFIDLYDRSIQFIEEMYLSKEENIVVVCHSAIIRSIISYILDFPLEKVFNLKIDYSSISKIAYDPNLEINSIEFLNFSPDNFKITSKD